MTMKGVSIRSIRCLMAFSILLLAVPALAQQDSTSTTPDKKGIDSGGYNIQESFELGYRYTSIDGNHDTYNTFVNLADGVRLLDFSLEMRSIGHDGVLFDTLSFSNFGYGGDPNDVTRLRISKNRLYDFRMQFRRDKNFWDYNLFANPLNPTTSKPTIPITISPNALDTVRRMQDYDLTLLPQSPVRFRLGYSRVVGEGPGFESYDAGVLPLLTTNYRTTENAYRAGVDFRVLRKTTLSYDQFLAYDKQDNITTDQNRTFLLPGLVPVDLGIIWNTTGSTPCASPCPTSSTLRATAFCRIPASDGHELSHPQSVSAFNQTTFEIWRCLAHSATATAIT